MTAADLDWHSDWIVWMSEDGAETAMTTTTGAPPLDTAGVVMRRMARLNNLTFDAARAARDRALGAKVAP